MVTQTRFIREYDSPITNLLEATIVCCSIPIAMKLQSRLSLLMQLRLFKSCFLVRTWHLFSCSCQNIHSDFKWMTIVTISCSW